jgi:hypothetical protein
MSNPPVKGLIGSVHDETSLEQVCFRLQDLSMVSVLVSGISLLKRRRAEKWK